MLSSPASRTFFTVALCLFPVAPALSNEPTQNSGTVGLVLSAINCSSGPYKPSLPGTIKEFQSLGKRSREQIQPASDYTGDPKDYTSANFWYEGMFLGVVFSNYKPYDYFLGAATFSHSRWNHLTPIKVGTSVRAFLTKENMAGVTFQTTLVRICSASIGAPDCIELSLKEQVVTEVKYICYTG
jgi:hypothetical protein